MGVRFDLIRFDLKCFLTTSSTHSSWSAMFSGEWIVSPSPYVRHPPGLLHPPTELSGNPSHDLRQKSQKTTVRDVVFFTSFIIVVWFFVPSSDVHRMSDQTLRIPNMNTLEMRTPKRMTINPNTITPIIFRKFSISYCCVGLSTSRS